MSAALESFRRLRERVASDRKIDLPSPRLGERLDALAAEGFAAFEAQGIPTRALEDWRGTNLTAVEAMDFTRIGPGRDSVGEIGEDADLVFVDGRLLAASASGADLSEGVRVLSLSEVAIEASEIPETYLGRLPDLEKESLVALQTALFEDAAIIHLEPRAEATRTIRIRSISTADDQATPQDKPTTPSASFPRLLVVAEHESAATIVFESVSKGDAPGLTAFVAEYHLAAGARIETVQIQAEGAERIHITSSHARLEGDAHFDSHVFSLGDGLVRSELSIQLTEPGAETRMRGFFLGRNRGHVDHFTTVDHAAEGCSSDQEYRGVLGDNSKGVFRGRVIVRPGAQRTLALQSNPNLLLSNRASIDTKPQLEIYADDIRASHGSTIGQLDAEALFFLRARGIDESVARLVLTRGFVHDLVEGIAEESARESVAERVEEALASLHPTLLSAPAQRLDREPRAEERPAAAKSAGEGENGR
ncbi:MAG: Fe-S cluster assembly protein SufD [bacterium]|nr:Fe-S cluster assembly protein SufD [bacterium]